MELVVPDKHNSTNDLCSDRPTQKDDATLATDQQDVTTDFQRSSDANLSPESSLEILPATQPTVQTLFGEAVVPAPAKQKLALTLPHFVTLDVDIIRTDSRMEKYLRQYKINTLYKPSSGLLTKESLLEVTFQEPVHVIRRDGYYWCVAGEELLVEAHRILSPPRSLPVLQRYESRKDSLLNIAVVEQLIQPARHQMEQVYFKTRVPLLID